MQELDGPHYTNGCCHFDEEYIGTVFVSRIVDGVFYTELLDVYIFTLAGGDEGVCLRFGDHDAEYASYDGWDEFLSAASNEHPRRVNRASAALEFLKMKGIAPDRRKEST